MCVCVRVRVCVCVCVFVCVCVCWRACMYVDQLYIFSENSSVFVCEIRIVLFSD